MKSVLALLVVGVVLFWLMYTMATQNDRARDNYAHGHAKAAYVRDPGHHCVEHTTELIHNDHKYLDNDGTLATVYGWRDWDCDNNVSVIIDNDEEQP
jgi:hypothetical protein